MFVLISVTPHVVLCVMNLVTDMPQGLKCHEGESQEEAECSSKLSHLKEMNRQNCEKQHCPSKLNFLKNSLNVNGWDGWTFERCR